MTPLLTGQDHSPRRILAHLADTGLMPSGVRSAADIVVTKCTSRNSGYLVEWVGGEAWFLKFPQSLEQAMTARHEAAVYRALSATDFHQLTPRLIHYEPSPMLLVLQGFPHTDPSDPLLISSRRSLVRAGRLLGRTLALLHDLPHGDDDPPALPPPSLRMDLPPLGLRAHLGGAASELIRLVQQDAALTGSLARCRDNWGRNGWTHGEIKWPHCLLCRAADEDTVSLVRLVDYEFAGVGDPAWDIGCVFTSYLGSWLASMPSPTAATAESMVCRSALSTRDVQEAVTALWRVYARQRGLCNDERWAVLEAALSYTVAGLLWRVLESCVTQSDLPPRAVLALQLAHNLAHRPREGARHLLGLPLT
ncbi:aminoglycoside phosphotransferase family protein [Streptomyces sp. NPDC005423]|uniref:aminoglycoside phosphotransferase family protein n=1 Tax=Streptomyces sp. NPDC005423 TaxID=3155343 RepID=UPI0033A07939